MQKKNILYVPILCICICNCIRVRRSYNTTSAAAAQHSRARNITSNHNNIKFHIILFINVRMEEVTTAYQTKPSQPTNNYTSRLNRRNWATTASMRWIATIWLPFHPSIQPNQTTIHCPLLVVLLGVLPSTCSTFNLTLPRSALKHPSTFHRICPGPETVPIIIIINIRQQATPCFGWLGWH